ncbi:MAG: large subunit ribosomal protein L18 [Flavobacteriaceae bacterium]|jgi:large subunit ribosomal protein L18
MNIKALQQKKDSRMRLKKKVRSRISGTAETPRLTVFKSNKFIYAQIINDVTGTTLADSSDIKETKGTKMERAEKIGTAIAEKAKENGISKVLFDRNGFKYTGRVAQLAEAARKAGLNF